MIEKNSFEPLYLQVKKDLMDQIEDGRIKVGDKLPSENEMMVLYGVSRMTVRSALSELVQEGCVRKEQGAGSFCIAVPEKIKHINVDVMMNYGDTFFVPYLINGINSILETENASLIIHDTKDSMQGIIDCMNDALKHGTDGVIFQLCHVQENKQELRKVLEQFRQKNIPTVAICGDVPDSEANSLNIDDYYGACAAASYMLECGHKKVLGLFSLPEYGAGERWRGVRETLGRSKKTSLFVENTDGNYMDRVLDTIKKEKITGIICHNDIIAVNCMHVLQENGFRIPEDVSIIGYDDLDISMSTNPQLTTISHPKDHMGRDAAKILLLHIRGVNTQRTDYIYRPELVIRQSVMKIN